MPLFDSLSRGELNLLAKHISCVKVKKHHIIAKEGDKGDFVCFIADGKVDVIKGDQKGNEVVINTLMKGRSIGEMSLIDNTPRSASLRTQTECVLLKLTKKSFDMILSQYPEMGIKILKGLARLLSMNLRKTSGRLADYLD
ncbi:MAG: hypothetical protein A2Y41_14375 [Spirochaetes bacterium GWB1_36_13]|nr:MAG: hypothetical protein A2Y41_14375 [Spirochaetes bacterium GWB1_36_13]